MKFSIKSLVIAAFVSASLLTAGGILADAQAQYYGQSCGSLWYARNAIYARNGYCFQTARARAVFGAGCFAPFGRLTGYDAQQVAQIQAAERAQGCSG